VLTIVIASVLSSTLIDHGEGFFFVYMSGLLFAGCGDAAMRDGPAGDGTPAAATRESGAPATRRAV
jgi:hypothetical protein